MALPREDIGDLFALYAASPASLELSANRLDRPGRQLAETRELLGWRQSVAVAGTGGDLVAPMSTVARPASETMEALSGASAFAAAAVRRWAGHVEAFDGGVRLLNARWRSAVATSFGQGYGLDARDGLSDARSALRVQLGTEHARLEAILDRAGDEVAGLLTGGASPDTLRDLFSTGDLSAAAFLAGGATGIEATVARLISTGVLPAEAAAMSAQELSAYLIEHPEVATRLMATSPQPGTPGSPEHDLARLLIPALVGPGGAAAYERQRQRDLRDLFSGMDPEDATLLAMLFPAAVGNTPGVPFGNRADANRVAVIAALADAEARLTEEQARDADDTHWWDLPELLLLGDVDGAEAHRIELYRSILAGDRQILFFDPAGDGAIAELHGDIGRGTDNVGVIVPGTTTELGNIGWTMGNAQSFVDNDPTGSLAMITWMGGDLPDSLLDAPGNGYAHDLAPSLAGFSAELAAESDAQAGLGTQVTVAGHSYGGAVVGLAETHGLQADRVLHIESAGMGDDVSGPGDYPVSQAAVDRYSMTAPGDPIAVVQGLNNPLWLDSLGHGADPDTFPGTTRLETGHYADGTWVQGLDAHEGVFTEDSDSWQNMYEVFTGGDVTLYARPYDLAPSPETSEVTIKSPNPGPRVTVDIP